MLLKLHLNNNNVKWTVTSNQFQIGALTYKYFGQIYPENSPLKNAFNIGFAVSKKYDWAKSGKKGNPLKESKPILIETKNENTIKELCLNQFFDPSQVIKVLVLLALIENGMPVVVLAPRDDHYKKTMSRSFNKLTDKKNYEEIHDNKVFAKKLEKILTKTIV